MPTASQCQIINSLVARETRRSYTPYILDDQTATVPEVAEVSPPVGTLQAIGPTPTPLTPLPNPVGALTPYQERPATTHGWRERQDYSSYNSRPPEPIPVQGHDSSYAGRAGSARLGHCRSLFAPRARSTPRPGDKDRRHREMTDFQKQCMENVERSLSPRTILLDAEQEGETNRQKESVDKKEMSVLAEMRIDFVNSNPRPRVLRESRSMATTQRPVVRFDSTVDVFGSPQRSRQNSQPQPPIVKIYSSEVKTTTTTNAEATAASVTTSDGGSGGGSGKIGDGGGSDAKSGEGGGSDAKGDESSASEAKSGENGGSDCKSGDGGDGKGGDVENGVGNDKGDDASDDKKDDTQAVLPAMSGISLRLPIVLTDEMRMRLYELGWRKPMPRRKIKKEEPTAAATVDLSNLPALMDLKKDPVLRKARKARVVSIQTKPPEPNPTAVCFNMLGSSLTHRDVWIAFKKDVLAKYPEVRLTSIEFVPRAIFVKRPKGGDPIEDRWVITFTSEWFRNRVAGMDLNFKGGAVQLRRYDDVVQAEYRQFTRMTDYMKMVNLKK